MILLLGMGVLAGKVSGMGGACVSEILEAAGYLSQEPALVLWSVHVLSISQAMASAPVSLNTMPGPEVCPGHSLTAQLASPAPLLLTLHTTLKNDLSLPFSSEQLTLRLIKPRLKSSDIF